MAFRRALLVLTAVLGLVSVSAHAELAIPRLSDAIVDQAGVFSSQERQQLSGSFQEFQRRFGPQLQLLVVKDLDGEPIESFSIRATDQWKLGDQKRDDGVLMVVALADRAVRLEVGQGLEGKIPDAVAGRIIQETMIPLFREGKVAAGIILGMEDVARALGGDLPGLSGHRESGGRHRRLNLFPLFFIFLLFFPHVLGRRGGGGALLTGMLLGGMLGGGSSRGGGGGGGFGGGGGGGFSGGGASGNW